MSAADTLTADSIIQDGDVWRWDWDGAPRFYIVRIYPHVRGVQLYVCLEGDPTAWSINFCPDNAADINEAVLDCISDIESLCAAQWDHEAEAEKRDCLTAYEQRFGF